MFIKATKTQAKLRCAIFGASGSGKTYSSLQIAQGLGNRIALIDTEYYSASKYSDRFDFDVANLENNKINSYIAAIKMAAQQEYEVLIIDSLSHAWSELLLDIEKIAKVKYKGNTWSAWSEGTPKQKELITSILSFPGHIIATMRCKTEWTTESMNNGKSRPVRVALAPEQGKGIEYEFDLLLELTTDHIANVIKDRTGKFQDKIIECPNKEFGEELNAWLNTGISYYITKDQFSQLEKALDAHVVDLDKFKEYFKISFFKELPCNQFQKAIAMIKSKPLKDIKDLPLQPKEEMKPPEVIPQEALKNEKEILEEKQKNNKDKIIEKLNKIQDGIKKNGNNA
jgi:hypothetical protein